MFVGSLLSYVSRVGNGPWMPSLMFKVHSQLQLGHEVNIKLRFGSFWGKLNQLFVGFLGHLLSGVNY